MDIWATILAGVALLLLIWTLFAAVLIALVWFTNRPGAGSNG